MSDWRQERAEQEAAALERVRTLATPTAIQDLLSLLTEDPGRDIPAHTQRARIKDAMALLRAIEALTEAQQAALRLGARLMTGPTPPPLDLLLPTIAELDDDLRWKGASN